MSTSPPLSALPAQLTLLGSLIAYPFLFFCITPRNATATRFSQSREAIGAAHTTVMTLISLYELRRNGIIPSPIFLFPSQSATSENPLPEDDTGASSPLATTRSQLANCITAIETSYLLQDAVLLILAARLRLRSPGGGKGGLAKEINWRLLGWHHAGLGAGLGMLQWYIAKGREKGILVVLMLFLMNASSPVGTLHWYLMNFRPEKKVMILLSNIGYLLMYGLCRVYLVYWVVHIFGAQSGRSAVEAFMRLRLSCRLGTATIGITNVVWLFLALRKFARRYLVGSGTKKRL